jgi:HK97 family phage major capsid protein
MTIKIPGVGIYDDLDAFIASFDYPDQAIEATARWGEPACRALHDYRKAIREEMAGLKPKLEAFSASPLASDNRRFDSVQRQWEAHSQEFTRAGEFLGQALTEAERNEASRKRFAPIFGRNAMEDNTELGDWIRHGGSPTFDVPLKATRTLGGTESHDLTTGGGSAGAVVPLGFSGAFYMHMIATAAVRQTNAIVYTTSGGEPLKIPKSTADPTAAIVAEGVAITPNDPSLGSVTLGAYGYKEMVYVSRELIQDSDVDIEGILGRLLGRAIGTASGTAYVTGNGSSAPQGVNLTPVAGVNGTWANLIAGATGPDLLTDVYFSVNAPYRPLGFWLMNDATLAAVRKLKATDNSYLVQRDFSQAPGETIFGRPVVTDPNMVTGAGVKDSILFGDFSSYFAIRDVGGVRLERSDDFRFANDEIAFRAVLRTDSKQVLNDTGNAAVKAFHQTA